jgi:deoxyribodipyrimidine photo-lyase
MDKLKIAIHWFRRDLRINDNAALYKALCSGLPVVPLFIFDTQILDNIKLQIETGSVINSLKMTDANTAETGDKRVDFIHRALSAIQQTLSHNGSSLLTVNGNPVKVFEKLLSIFNIVTVYCNEDYEPYAIERDNKIETILNKLGAKLVRVKDQVIFEKREILKSDGSPYTVFTPYSKKWTEALSITKDESLRPYNTANHIDNFISLETLKNLLNGSSAGVGHNKDEPCIGLLTLKQIGFKKTDLELSGVVLPWQDGFSSEIISSYHLTRNFPALRGTSMLSTHLRFGTVSTRELVAIALEKNRVWLNELIWREFFKMIMFHFPYVTDEPFKKKYRFIQWRNDAAELERWCNGTTGYPIVDAGMRELNQTGLMHNRVRMITASFLIKHLLIDWRVGEAYFAQKLLDYDLSSNNGNWQWAAGCGCDAAPYFRVFNPWEQTKRFDPQMEYIKKWVPEAVNTGDDSGFNEYPAPVIEHKKARERALEVYKNSLRIGPDY